MYSLVLVVGFLAGGMNSGSVAMEHIDGFVTKQSCEKAGEDWINGSRIFEKGGKTSYEGREFVCVQVPSAQHQ